MPIIKKVLYSFFGRQFRLSLLIPPPRRGIQTRAPSGPREMQKKKSQKVNLREARWSRKCRQKRELWLCQKINLFKSPDSLWLINIRSRIHCSSTILPDSEISFPRRL